MTSNAIAAQVLPHIRFLPQPSATQRLKPRIGDHAPLGVSDSLSRQTLHAFGASDRPKEKLQQPYEYR